LGVNSKCTQEKRTRAIPLQAVPCQNKHTKLKKKNSMKKAIYSRSQKATLKIVIGAIPMCFTKLLKIYFNQNTTNLLLTINVATCFDS
jgi:hypothetical protein